MCNLRAKGINFHSNKMLLLFLFLNPATTAVTTFYAGDELKKAETWKEAALYNFE